jgi:hypothetical protein
MTSNLVPRPIAGAFNKYIYVESWECMCPRKKNIDLPSSWSDFAVFSADEAGMHMGFCGTVII